jgi:chemotaxis protein MotB
MQRRMPSCRWQGTSAPRPGSERCIRNIDRPGWSRNHHSESLRCRSGLLPAAPDGSVTDRAGDRERGAHRRRRRIAANYDDPSGLAKLRGVAARSSARRWRFASGFLFFGALTVVAGFYVPLRREATRLRSEDASMRRELEQTRAELNQALARPEPASAAPLAPRVASAAPPAPLVASGGARKDPSASVQPRIDRLVARLGERFAELARAQKLSISRAGDRISVAVANQQLFAGSRLDLTPGGRSLLCDLAQTIMAEFAGQLRVTGYYGKPRIVEPALSRRYATPWELSAARAARAVDALVRDCRAPAERFLVVGYGPRSAGPLGENVAFELIFTDAD